MKKLWFKALSFIISFLMVFYMIPMSVYADMFDNIGISENDSVENDASWQRIHDVFEAADRREETVKQHTA